MEELISVIVPMYNAEKTIKRCIKSILIQEQVDYEIIIIDDGSTDHSLEICRALEKKHREIIVYHTKNKGVSHARNFGLEKAKGKWVVFVDADDELVEGALLEAQKMQQEQRCDLVCGNMYCMVKGNVYPARGFHIESNIITKEDMQDLRNALFNIPSEKNKFYGEMIRAPWGKMYLSEIIKRNGIKFPEKLSLGEGAIFLFEYLHYCNLVVFIDKPLYKYYKINNSIVGKYRENFLEDLGKELVEIEQVYSKHCEDSNQVLNLFLQSSLMNYMHNEYQSGKTGLYLIIKVNKFLKEENIKKYLVRNNKGRLSALKIYLLRHKGTALLAFLYVKSYISITNY